jgi:hypothetical protein
MRKLNIQKRQREQVTEKISDLHERLNDKVNVKQHHFNNTIFDIRTQINDTPPGECTKELDAKLSFEDTLQNSWDLDIALLKKQIEFLNERIVDNEFEF